MNIKLDDAAGLSALLCSLRDCGDFSMTVRPFIPQLYALSSRLLELSSLADLRQLYLATNPLISAFAASLFLAGVFLVVSEINKNYSQVDRFWSLLPNLYVVHFAVWARLSGLPHARIDLVAAFTTLWSIRLTFNYWRRGGYKIGSEDYRWAIVKSKLPAVLFFLLNATFISFIQSILLFAISSLPAYAILLSTLFEPEVKTADISYFVIELALVLSEFVSDGQQWAYQSAKQQYQKDAKVPRGWCQADLDRGFIATGLWAYSRHPNFLAEQTIWFLLYQWSCYATNTLYNWTFVASASLILLFQGSTLLTESITAGKYPEYGEYRRRVGIFIPISLRPYQTPSTQPKIIRTSELAQARKKKTKKT